MASRRNGDDGIFIAGSRFYCQYYRRGRERLKEFAGLHKRFSKVICRTAFPPSYVRSTIRRCVPGQTRSNRQQVDVADLPGGGSSDDVPLALALDPPGNIAVAGVTQSLNFPITSDAFQKVMAGGVENTD